MVMKIIFYEDAGQLDKIKNHVDFQCNLFFVEYVGRKIKKIQYKEFGKSTKTVSYLFFILNIFKTKVMLCEYANAIPRLYSFFFFKKLESHIFGYLLRGNFDFDKKINIFKKVFYRLYADKYYIYGSNNPTVILESEIKKYYLSEVEIKKRKDLEEIKNKSKKGDWVLFIGQPWRENNYLKIYDAHKILFKKIIEKYDCIIYCKHPRETMPIDFYGEIINGWNDLNKKILKDGLPKLAIGINSSLIREIEGMGVEILMGCDEISFFSEDVIVSKTLNLVKSISD